MEQLLLGGIYKGDSDNTIKICERDGNGELFLKVLLKEEWKASWRYRLASSLAARLASGLSAEAVASCYEWRKGCKTDAGDDFENSLLLFGLLASQAFNHIRVEQLAETDLEYQAIIKNLAELSGLFHSEDQKLAPEQVQQCFRDNLLPMDILCRYNRDEVNKKAHYTTLKRFNDVMRLAYDILIGYENFASVEQLKPNQYDGWANVLQTALEVIQECLSWERYRKQRKLGEVNKPIREGPEGTIDFDL